MNQLFYSKDNASNLLLNFIVYRENEEKKGNENKKGSNTQAGEVFEKNLRVILTKRLGETKNLNLCFKFENSADSLGEFDLVTFLKRDFDRKSLLEEGKYIIGDWPQTLMKNGLLIMEAKISYFSKEEDNTFI